MTYNGIFDISRSGSMILDMVRQSQAISRSDLTAATGLPQQTVHRLSSELVSNGLLDSLPPKIKGRGKPSPELATRADGAFGFGLAVDTDTCRLCVVDLGGTIRWSTTLDAEPNEPDRVIAETQSRIFATIEKLGLPPNRIAGLGVSMQGFRSTGDTSFRTPARLDRWDKIELQSRFGPMEGLPALAENNATLGAIAELWTGAGRQHSEFAYLSFNFGFGAGVVLDGRPYLGCNLNAGEISRVYTEEENQIRPALQILLKELHKDGIAVESIAQLRADYDPNWPAVDRWVALVAPQLNIALRAIIALLDPAVVIFGGEAPVDLRERLIRAAVLKADDGRGREIPLPELVLGHNDDDPSLIGASLLPILTRLFRW
ncbi:ROK family protein [Paracoccus albus]|uniref:ROK family protein n=1 Tax=Paracoccus albus TaxID=3017784 RepID=UPI0022F0920E|nr:ROK family protein [Paracoccus albus]WBU60841.1 ROK family protein [Paracoccus albus]